MLEVHKCNDTEKMSNQDADVDFDPNAPQSSTMDNVLLKVLFGVPNVKMRQYPTQEKKTIQIDLSSAKGHVDSFDSVRAKLRESFTSALAMVGDEQPKKDVKAENNFQIDSTVLNRHASED